jgi:hypothetical protein
MTAYITLNTASEFLCFCVSLFFLYKDTDRIWKGFIVFLLLTCLVELFGLYVRHVWHKPNFAVYNTFLLVECVVLNIFFYSLIKTNRSLKKLLIAWLLFFVLFYVGELYIRKFSAYVSTSSTLMSVELIVASIYYYYVLIKEEASKPLARYAPFWWVNGTICFYFAGIACNIFFNYLVQDKTSSVTFSARYIIVSILNVILYASWSYSFICRYLQRNSASLSE